MGKQAVEAPRGTHFNFDPDELTIIGLDTDDDKSHPLYDPRIGRPLDPSRINNFRMYGVIKPIRVRKNGDKVEVVDGRGRVRYARAVKALQIAAGEETIRVPALMTKADDAHLYGISRAANIHDADGPMTMARNAQKMLDMGKSVAEAATTFAVTEQTIRNWTLMLDLDASVIDAMIADEISATAAGALAGLPKAQQREVLAEVKAEALEGTKPTVERVKRKAAEKAGKAAPTNTPKARIERATNLLLKFTGSGQTKEDYAQLVERLCKVVTGSSLEKLAKSEDE
jgi:ParB-like chromosome segregation protein Spo0J